MSLPDTSALIAKYEALLAKRPDDELVHFSLGKAYYDAQRWAEAQDHLQQALKAKPDWMVVTILLAKIARQNNEIASARHHYESALQLAIDQHHEGPEEEVRTALADLQTLQ